MSDVINREFEAYRKDDAEARAILDTAASENRSTTAEEDQRFDRLLESAAAHKARADKLATMDKEGAELAAAVRSRIGDVSESGALTTDRGDAQFFETVRLYHSGLGRGERPREVSMDLRHNDEVRVITDSATSASLYASDFSTKVAVYQRTLSPWLRLATVITADNGRPLILPNLSVDPTSYTPGEGTAITPSDPTLGTVTATPLAYKALGYISQEATEDELIGLLGLIAQQQGRTLGLGFGTAVTAAVLSGATNGGTATGVGGDGTAVVTFIGYEDLLDLKYSAAAPYRTVGVWVMANGLMKKVRKFKDADKQYYWQPAIAAGQPATFDGDPVYEDPILAAPASATKSVVYGDPTALVIKQMPLRVAVSTEFAFNLDNVAIKSVYRAGGAIPDAAALRYLVSANT